VAISILSEERRLQIGGSALQLPVASAARKRNAPDDDAIVRRMKGSR
jgi:hypothetical protein